ncbi:MAG: HNH endonuclease [Streptosporangiaceae bacterium]
MTGRVDAALLGQLAAQLLSRPPVSVPDAGQVARDLILAQAVQLLSGPGALASMLRDGVPVSVAATASLPLDVGKPSDTVPPHLRRAVIIRDQACRFPGCHQPPAACEVHHVTWKSRGGRDQLINLVLLCRFHHLIAIHQWGWAITLHPDATVTAVSPDRGRTLHGHSPPATAAA